jgi:hypothetical protein
MNGSADPSLGALPRIEQSTGSFVDIGLMAIDEWASGGLVDGFTLIDESICGQLDGQIRAH